MAWHCPAPAQLEVIDGKDAVVYTLHWTPPKPEDIGVLLAVEPLKVSDIQVEFSWEERCRHFETLFCDPELDLVCPCCAGVVEWTGKCDSCRYAVGWHICHHEENECNKIPAWKPGTLFDGPLDVERVILNLHRRGLPMDVLEQKAEQYVEKELISREKADTILEIARGERGQARVTNVLGGDGDEDGNGTRGTRKLNSSEMAALLAKRESQMREGGTDEHPTDQSDTPRDLSLFFRNLQGSPKWACSRALARILAMVAGLLAHRAKVGCWRWRAAATDGPSQRWHRQKLLAHQRLPLGYHKRPQMSCGSTDGHSRRQYRDRKHRGWASLLMCIWFYVLFMRVEVGASTLHSLFDLGANYESKLDFTKRHETVVAILRMSMLLLDEVSMIDCDIFEAIAKQLGIADHTRRGTTDGFDEYGSVHLVLFGDFKQLPPATSDRGRRARNTFNTACLLTSPPPHRESAVRRAFEASRPSFLSRASTNASTFECCDKTAGS